MNYNLEWSIKLTKNCTSHLWLVFFCIRLRFEAKKTPKRWPLSVSQASAESVYHRQSCHAYSSKVKTHNGASLSLSLSLSRLFLCLGYGYKGVRWKENNIILTCVSVVYWAMWYSRNDSVFLFVDTFQNYTSDKIRDLSSEGGAEIL